MKKGMQIIKRILLTGGGTAGHVNPALAIGSALATEETSFLFVGVRGRVEEQVVPREGMPITYVRAAGFPGGFSLKMAWFLLNLGIGILQSIIILLRFRPDVIVGTGGFVSAPIIMAAGLLKKIHLFRAPVFIHEQNAVPGKLNQLMARFADKILVTFPETLAKFPRNSALVGYPLRKRIAKESREEALQKIDLKIPEGRKVILAFGGSQGSRTLNRALVDALEYLLPYRDRLFIIHGVGLFKTVEYNAEQDTYGRLHRLYDTQKLKEIESFYAYRPFFYDIERWYAASDLVVARGGAGSLNEISAMGLPALIIPKANLPGDHQVMNARSMERAGGAEILYEQIAPVNDALAEWVDGKILAEKLLSLALDDAKLQIMSRKSCAFLNQDALDKIGRIIRSEETGPAGSSPAATLSSEDIELPSNRSLLTMLEKELQKHPTGYKLENVIPRAQDLDYFINRASALLIYEDWMERNLGVKLLGLLQAKQKIPALLTLFNDRKRVSPFKRLFGGDFVQVGFIRRNIITALVRINDLLPEVEKAILAGFEDPYYEVRTESALASAFFGNRLSSTKPFIKALLNLLGESNIDVCSAAAEALGRIGSEHDAFPALLQLWDTRYWRLRTAALRGLVHLVERGQIANLKILEEQAPRFILTSTDFKPHFEIKFGYRRLIEAIAIKKEKSAHS
jgi:UDP-N-acetylglucosamine--N-acetylmuramyl-(pentapeptide) pyrophosphoryl-undecaprenol N-acetylglucosamine transferase